MTEYAYTMVPGKLKELLAKIRQVGVPAKVTNAWLKTVGFTSSNDTSLLSVLKFIDLVDSSGTPTQRWNQFRGANHKRVLGEAVVSGYKELYSIYQDSHSRNKGELSHVFSTSSTAGQQVISKTVATFKALCDEAIFDTENSGGSDDTTLVATPVVAKAAAVTTRTPNSPSVHIDVQVHISPESTSEQIDTIFKSMAKHLYGSKD